MKNYRVYSGELYHHGVKGQKWGVRRFQNEDGSWTPEGLERRKRSGAEQVRAKAKNILKNTYSSDNDRYGFFKFNSKDARCKRAAEAADLGLKTLERLGYSHWDEIDDSTRWWFLFEDQTVGMAAIADMVNQGYTADECKALIEESDKIYRRSYSGETDIPTVCFELANGGDLNGFAEECEKVKNKEKRNG